jgi:hypothetical protein
MVEVTDLGPCKDGFMGCHWSLGMHALVGAFFEVVVEPHKKLGQGTEGSGNATCELLVGTMDWRPLMAQRMAGATIATVTVSTLFTLMLVMLGASLQE